MSILFLLLLGFAAAEDPEIFFKLFGETPKCFIIDEPVGTLIHAHYKVSSVNSGKYGKDDSIDLHYTLQFPQETGKEEEDSAIDADGVVMFTTKDVGEYNLCFYVKKAPRYDTEYKFALNLEVGIEAIDYDNIAKTEQLNGLKEYQQY